MTAESDKKGRKKMLLVIIPICIILIIALFMVYIFINASPRSISKFTIITESTINIDFDTQEVYIPDVEIDDSGKAISNSETKKIDEDKLKEYQLYLIDFYKSVNSNRKVYTQNNDSGETQRRYWSIELIDQNDKKFSIDGLSAYPKDWPEFIAKTNELLGEDYLSDDTHGLPLK